MLNGDRMLTRRYFPQALLAALVSLAEACGGISGSPEAPIDGGTHGAASDGQTSEAESDGETPDAVSDGDAPDVDNGGGDDCGAIEVLPPSFTILTSLMSAGCNPTFTVVDSPASAALADGGADTPSRTYPEQCPGLVGCPPTTGDGGPTCQFVLEGLIFGSPGPFTIQVSQPGFAPVVVSDVETGVTGCVPTVSASQIQVTLLALAPLAQDAGADAM